MNYYDRFGNPVIHIDNGDIYSFKGVPLAYVYLDTVYSFSGKQLGWFVNGWIYDMSGCPLLFSEASTGGPVKPVRRVAPVALVNHVSRVKAARKNKTVRPVLKMNWSNESIDSFFRD